ARIHGARSVRARHRLRRVSRRRLVLPEQGPRRRGNAQPGRRRRALGRESRGVAVRQLSPRLPRARVQPGSRRQAGRRWIVGERRISLNTRFAMPDGILNLYEPGSEGPQWWGPWPDTARGLGTTGILDRCTRTSTCPKIFEHFGAAEVWGLKLTPEWVGTA